MSSSRFLLTACLSAALLAGCSSTDQAAAPTAPAPASLATPTPASTTPATASKTAATDFGRLLLTAEDVSDADDRFVPRPQAPQANDATTASAFFVNEKDTRAISDGFVVHPDAAAATAALQQAASTLPTLVTGGTPAPYPVGTGGVLVRGRHPNEAKDVTLLLFTEGRALVRLEFQSATGDATTDRFVTCVGKMQQIALRVGLGGQ